MRRPNAVEVLVVIVALGVAWTLTFPHSPEDWTQLVMLRSRGFFGCMQPFAEYPYYRPLWFGYLKTCEVAGWSGGLSHIGPACLHVGGTLLVYAILRRLAQPTGVAMIGALFAGLAPGNATALSWLAAGNKVFTFFFLALGALLVLRATSWRGFAAAVLFGALPAVASSENGYLCAMLLPLVALLLRPKGTRLRPAAAVFVAAFVIVATHHFLLSPQTSTSVAGDRRFEQLRTMIAADPVAWFGDFLDNLGRYFVFGLGIVEDAPRVGIFALATTLVVAAVTRSAALFAAIFVYVLLNLPASLFRDEISRHQGYLPAVGAGLVAAQLLFALRGVKLAPIAIAWFLAQGWIAQAPWSRYLHHVDAVAASLDVSLPQLPGRGQVILVNVPLEYKAALRLRFGDRTDVDTWPTFAFIANRDEILLPDSVPLPVDSPDTLLEYDGTALRATTFAELAKRKRAAMAWFVDRVTTFRDRNLAWAEIVSSDGPLSELALSFSATPREAEAGGARGVRVLSQEVTPTPGVRWTVEAELASPGWLVLGWAGFPVTENAAIFYMRELPWLFDVTCRSVGDPEGRLELPTHPVLGFLPAVWLEAGKHHLIVDLAMRPLS